MVSPKIGFGEQLLEDAFMIRGFPCARCRGLVVAVVCTCCLFAPVVAPAVALPDDQPHVEITSDEPPAI